MSAVMLFELILLLMVAVVGLELVAARLSLPPAAALIIGGMALPFIPGLPPLELDPDLALVLFLPPLLMAGGFFTAWRDFRADLQIILGLAVGAVVFTTAAVAWIAHWVVPGLPWAACFALGAIVSPPDAVSAKAVLKGLPLPRRVLVLLEGESLVNDATGLVLFRFAVAASLTGTFSAGQAVANFGLVAAGGVAVGIVCGRVLTAIFRRLADPIHAAISSLLMAWASYIGAQAIGVSGVLATVACGLMMGWSQHDVLTGGTRLHGRVIWDLVVFVLESLVFILIGLSLRGVLERLGGLQAVAVLLPAMGAVIAVVVLSRFVWIFTMAYGTRFVCPPLRRRDPYPPVSVLLVMSWTGMRGVVSLAAALTLPEAFPGRDFILAATFAVILVTVLLQGGTLAPMIRALGAGRLELPAATTLTEDQARARMLAAEKAAIDALAQGSDGTLLHPRLVEQFGYKADAACRYSANAVALKAERQAHFEAVLQAVGAGRREVLNMHRHGEIHASVLHALERELDLEEISALGLLGKA